MPSQNPVDISVFDLVTVIIPDPGAGNQIEYACPVNARIEILYLGFIFNTAAIVSSRYVQVLGVTPTLSQTMGACAIPQTTTLTWGWAWVAGLPQLVDLSAQLRMIIPMSPSLVLKPGDSLETSIINMQATDVISSIICRYRQWIIA